MKKLSKKTIVNENIYDKFLNKDFVVLTSKVIIPTLLVYKKGLLKYMLPGNFLNYKKVFQNFTLIDFKVNILNILTYIKPHVKVIVFNGKVFKNNLIIFKNIIMTTCVENICKVYPDKLIFFFIILNINLYLKKKK